MTRTRTTLLHVRARRRHPGSSLLRFFSPRALAVIATIVALVATAALAAPATPAFADQYPSWADVQAAKGNQARTQAEITAVQTLLAGLKTDAANAQTAAQTAGAAMQQAQEAFFDADQKASAAQATADELAKQATTATTRAGQLAAQLYRSGGRSMTTSLLLAGASGTADPDQLLAQLGSMTRLVESTGDIYASAAQKKNTATAAAAQAKDARATRKQLKAAADQALAAANSAQQLADAKLTAQQQHADTLNAQLAALKDTTTKTVMGYQAGVAARAAAAKAAAEAAARARAEAAKKAQTAVSASGWATPVYGPITDGFGPRPAPCAGCTTYHLGADVGAAYRTSIRAAHSGTVTYAGWAAGYGNFVIITDGDGTATAYGHIIDGGILVAVGQHVTAGQQIAEVGSTGHSTGPHLHFEVRVNGVQIDPIAWMRTHGAPLGT